MKNNNMKHLNSENEKEKEINVEEPISEISEETEEEIIDNNYIDEDDDEEDIEKKRRENNKNESKIKNYNNQNIPECNKNKNIIKKNEKQKEDQNITNKNAIIYNDNKDNQLIQNKPHKTKFQEYYSPKFDFARKKHKKIEEEEKPDDLFIKAFEKNNRKIEISKEYHQKVNTLSTKVADILYDKYVSQNKKKSKTIDTISKMIDEEMKVNRDALRTKEDSKRINNMLNRQKYFEKVKINKLKEREQKINNEINKECIFMPNGINTSSRTPEDFYDSQLKFIEKKKDNINQLQKNITDNENKNKNVNLTSKISEKIVSNKNPNESKEEFLKRLHSEKLKTIKEKYEKPKKMKKLTKEEVNNLANKLYEEGKIFKENKEKGEREKLLKELKNASQELISEKSNEVLLNKFIKKYEKILFQLFNKNNNFQISFEEYKLLLNNIGCINQNSLIDEDLAKESFNKYLKQKDSKIDTYSFLVFALAALGIYKGNEELNQKNICSNKNIENNKRKIKINYDSKNNLIKNKRYNNSNSKSKTCNELIKMNISDLDLNKYGYSNKITKIIKNKFFSFVKGLNGSLIADISNRKEEKEEKIKDSEKREENRMINKYKKSIKNDKKRNIKNYSKLEDIYKVIQQKKENEIKLLRAKKEEKELSLCTFHPNINKSNITNNKNIDKNLIQKNIEKLYQEGKTAYIHKKNIIGYDPEDTEENKINCTFKPIINQYNNEMFNKNPLKDDMKRFEKIREQRMNKSQKKYERPMNFVIESKINKEDIIDRVIPNKSIYKNEYKYDLKIKEENTPLLKVEVNLDDKNSIDTIIIYPGDDIKEKTNQFCLKHKLNEEKKNTLLTIIMKRIKENKDIYENNYDENNNDQKKRLKENKEITKNEDEKDKK